MYADDQVIVKKYNRDAAVIISKAEYERLKDPTKRLTSSEWESKFKKIEALRAKVPHNDPEILSKEIKQAIIDARKDKKRSKT